MRWFTSKKSKKTQENHPQGEEPTETSISISHQNSIQSNQVHPVHQRAQVVPEIVTQKPSVLDGLLIFSAGLAVGEDACELW